MISEKRQLIYDLFGLSYPSRLRVLYQLNLISREEMSDHSKAEIELLKLAMGRAKERNQLGECRAAVAKAKAAQEASR